MPRSKKEEGSIDRTSKLSAAGLARGRGDTYSWNAAPGRTLNEFASADFAARSGVEEASRFTAYEISASPGLRLLAEPSKREAAVCKESCRS